jgi:RES domain-containing protein
MRLQSDPLFAGWGDPDPSSQDEPTQAQKLGFRWLSKMAVLGVHSVIIPQERIYVLNPAHPEFQYIEFGDSAPYRFDYRLKQSAG